MNVTALYAIILIVLGLVFWRRAKEMLRPIKGPGIKILLPIIYLLPLYFVLSQNHLHLNMWELGLASLTGALLSIPLILTTNYEIREDGQIYVQKNKIFFIALISVLFIRIALRQIISGLDPASLAFLFFTVAISYVVPWRVASFVKFRVVKYKQNFAKTMVPSKL